MAIKIHFPFRFLLFVSAFAVLFAGCENSGRQNALASETSPYLLQHAENPVYWQPWSDAIWEMAREEDKLVLISIGYSSCHWCHVMEEETFEDDSVAAFMNERFISVKVDREERPDVDQVYMTAVQLMGSPGGWPLNVLVLPNGKPLYGGTYHSREEWVSVLGNIDSLYRADRGRAEEYADKVANGIAQTNIVPAPQQQWTVERDGLASAVLTWKDSWDPEWGGNTGQQKFMLPSNLEFLMNYVSLTQDPSAKAHLELTIQQISRGGVYDHIGGGFFRYSTDPGWKVPHFEKMLYDTAQLIGVYAQAYRYFGTEEYRRVVEESFAFLKREMKAEPGGYYSAMDADSEGEEGRYYVWSADELKALLGEDYKAFSTYYQVRPENEWEGKHILRKAGSTDELAAVLDTEATLLQKKAKQWKSLLLERRNARSAPALDRKIITSWNALLLQGLCEAYVALGEEEYVQEARDLYGFLKSELWNESGLAHAYTEGVVQDEGFLEDYAFLGRAVFRLYQITGDESYLEDARTLLEDSSGRFGQGDSPLFRFTEETELIASIVKTDDGVLPAPNTALAELMLNLGHFYYEPELLEQTEEMVSLLYPRFLQTPQFYSGWGTLALKFAYPFYEVAVVGPGAGELSLELQREFLPNALTVYSEKESGLPLFAMRYSPEETSIFVCRDHACKMPVQKAADAWEQLREEQGKELFNPLQ